MLDSISDKTDEDRNRIASPAGSSSVQSFRTEIMETVKSLVELNKLKIILSSGLIAIAFGVGTPAKVVDYSYLTLSFVPFVCLYIDYQFYHGLAKIFVIARFMEVMPYDSPDVRMMRDYEQFVQRVRERAAPKLFSFEARAQIGSSMALAVGAPVMGVLTLVSVPGPIAATSALIVITLLLVSAAAGAILIWVSFQQYHRELARMRTVPVSIA